MKYRINLEKVSALLRGVFIASLLSAMVVVQFLNIAPLAALRTAFFDFTQRLLETPSITAPITIIDIDDESIAAFGQWPWPRDRIAELVAMIARSDPAAIGIDLIFPEPDRLSPENVLSGLEVSAFMRQQLADLPTNDQALATSLKAAPTVLASAAARWAPTVAGRTVSRTPIELKLGWRSTPRLKRYPGLLTSLPLLEAASAGSGIASVELDRDGVIRRLPAVVLVDDAIVPSFAIEVARTYLRAPAIGVEIEGPGISGLTLGASRIATDTGGNIWLRHAPPNLFHRLSAADILYDRFEPDNLKGRVILVGATGVGLTKSFVSAGGTAMSALDAQALFVENLLSQSYLRRTEVSTALEIFATLLGCIGIVFLRGRLRSYGGQAAVLLYAVLLIAASLIVYEVNGVLLDPTFSLIAILITYLIFIGGEIVATQQERRQTDEARRTALVLAESASHAKTNFLAGMSHELRTPLNAILGFSEMIKDEVLGPVSPPNYASYAKDIHVSAGHLLGVVTQILDMANLESGETRLRTSEFDLRAALDESVETIRGLGATDRTDVSIIAASPMPVLRADRRMVSQMLLNLILNAVKFSPPGGQVIVSSEYMANGDFCLAVTDAGSGMSPQQVAAAFEMFQASDQAVSDSARGIGLGLPVTTSMIEEHGGSIRVTSHEGQGTRMTLVFPENRIVR